MQAIDDEAIFWSGKTQKRTVPAASRRTASGGAVEGDDDDGAVRGWRLLLPSCYCYRAPGSSPTWAGAGAARGAGQGRAGHTRSAKRCRGHLLHRSSVHSVPISIFHFAICLGVVPLFPTPSNSNATAAPRFISRRPRHITTVSHRRGHPFSSSLTSDSRRHRSIHPPVGCSFFPSVRRSVPR